MAVIMSLTGPGEHRRALRRSLTKSLWAMVLGLTLTGCMPNVNEPRDPDTYVDYCTKHLLAVDLPGKVEKVLYVNLDFNGCIFEGDLDVSSLTRVADVGSLRRLDKTVLNANPRQNRFFAVLTAPGKPRVYAFAAATTKGELIQAIPILQRQLGQR